MSFEYLFSRRLKVNVIGVKESKSSPRRKSAVQYICLR